MLTAAHLRLLGQGNSTEWDQAYATLKAAAGDPNAYQVVVTTLAETDQEGVAFWCLDALIKQFGPMLQGDAPRLIPLLLAQLVRPFAVVPDRAAWALNVTGPASVPALLHAFAQSSDPTHRAMYLGALRGSVHLFAHAPAVLACLAQALQDPAAQVRSWALEVVTKEASPLRLGAETAPTIKALYHAALPVAEELIRIDHDEMARRYYDLIAQYLHSTGEKA